MTTRQYSEPLNKQQLNQTPRGNRHTLTDYWPVNCTALCLILSFSFLSPFVCTLFFSSPLLLLSRQRPKRLLRHLTSLVLRIIHQAKLNIPRNLKFQPQHSSYTVLQSELKLRFGTSVKYRMFLPMPLRDIAE